KRCQSSSVWFQRARARTESAKGKSARVSKRRRSDEFISSIVGGRAQRGTNRVRQVICLERSIDSLLPLLPKKGGEGWGEEAVFRQFPLSPALSSLVPHGERGKKPSAFFMPNTIGSKPAIQKVGNPRYDNGAFTPLVMVSRFCRAGKPVCHPRKSAALARRRFDLPGRSTDRYRARS